MQTLHAVQALRGIAALLVALAHIRQNLNFGDFRMGDWLFQNGAVAVDLFFILSGMIMVFSANRLIKSGSPALTVQFALNRLCRVVPLYWIATVTFAALRFGPSIFNDPAIYVPLIKSLLFLPQSSAGAPQFGYATVFVGWTLNYEMLFYSVFALSLSFGRARWFALFGMFALLLIALPLALSELPSLDAYVNYGAPVAYLGLASNPIIWDFLLGVGIGLVIERRPLSIPKSLGLIALGLMGLLCAAQYFTSYRSGHGLSYSALPLAALVFLLANHEIRFGIRVPNLLVYLGDISYSLYLWHTIIYTVLYGYLRTNGYLYFADGPAFLLVALPTTIAISHLSQRLIEQRLSNWIRISLERPLRVGLRPAN